MMNNKSFWGEALAFLVPLCFGLAIGTVIVRLWRDATENHAMAMPAPVMANEVADEIWQVVPNGEVLVPVRHGVASTSKPALILRRVGENGSRLAYLNDFAVNDYPRAGEYVREDSEGYLHRLTAYPLKGYRPAETQPSSN